MARNTARWVTSANGGRAARHPGDAVSQRTRKRVEEIFGWLKTVGLMRRLQRRGTARAGYPFTFTMAIHNLARMRNLVLPSG